MKGAPEIFRCALLCHVVFGFSGLEGVHPPKDARDAQRRPGGLVDLQDRNVEKQRDSDAQRSHKTTIWE